MGSVTGKVAVITGGANGIGAEVARRLHAKGAKVVLIDLDDGRLKELAGALGDDRVLTAVADVRELPALVAAVEKAVERFGGIDTVMVRDSKSDLPTIKELIESLPGPLGKTTTVQKCGEAFVKGIEGRKRRVYCPQWVGLIRWLRPPLATAIGESATLKSVPDLLPRMDAEVAALGRSTSAHTEALEKRA